MATNTMDAFVHWAFTCDDATTAFIARLVMTYLDGIFVFQQGVRANNSTIMLAGCTAFMSVWWSRNHPHDRSKTKWSVCGTTPFQVNHASDDEEGEE